MARPRDGDGNGTAVCDIGAYEVGDPSADLSITKVDSPDPIGEDGFLLYAITVTNNGPGDAFDVFVEDVLPPTVTFVNASRNCTGTTTVVCRVGTLGAGESETILIEATADEVGTTSNTATMSSSTPDPNFANNSSTALRR